MLIENNEIEDKDYFYCSTVSIDSLDSSDFNKENINHQINSIQGDITEGIENNEKAIILLSKSGSEVEQRIIIPCGISEDGSLVNLLSSSAYFEGKDLRVSTDSVINITGAAFFTYYPSDAKNSYRGPFYIPRTVSFSYLGAPSGYTVNTIKASLRACHLYHDVTTGSSIGSNYTTVSSVASRYSPSIGVTYSGNFITFPTNYGFPIDTNGVSTYSKLILELTYTYSSKTYYYVSTVDVFSGETIWDLEDPVETD